MLTSRWQQTDAIVVALRTREWHYSTNMAAPYVTAVRTALKGKHRCINFTPTLKKSQLNKMNIEVTFGLASYRVMNVRLLFCRNFELHR